MYNVIWTFNPGNSEISLYNVISTEVRKLSGAETSILSPGLALPMVSTCFVPRAQAAMHLLGCLDTLTQAQNENFAIVEENECNQSIHGKVFSSENFSRVNRFKSEYIFFFYINKLIYMDYPLRSWRWVGILWLFNGSY